MAAKSTWRSSGEVLVPGAVRGIADARPSAVADLTWKQVECKRQQGMHGE